MKKVYYTDKETNEGTIKTVLTKALDLIEKEDEINSIILLFPTLSVADDVLANILPELTRGNRSLHSNNPSCGIRVETLKNYSANFLHILIPFYVSERDFSIIEDEWYARIWIVAPYDFSAMENWLRVHSAENVKTGETITLDSSLDERVINGIEWLWATSFPNEGFIHPLDSNRLKCMANALAAKNVPLDYYAVLHYCITHKINHDGGRKIADHFVKAQTRKFKTDGNYPLSFMTEMMNTKHKRI